MTGELVRYDAACRAVAECNSVDEAKDIRDRAIAMAAYARQAKNKDLATDAELIRCRAELRLGEMLKEQKATVGLNRGLAGSVVTGSEREPLIDTRPKLSDAGIDKKLSSHAQAVASIPKDEFSRLLDKRNPKAIQHAAKRQVRKAKHQEIARKAKLLSHDDRKFSLIYADPPWVFETFAESGQAKTAEKHYPTITDTEIAAFKYGSRSVADISARDALLFMWCTPANLVRALAIVAAWGFEYKTHLVWVKDKAGTGIYARQQHEPLLLCTKGSPPRPESSPPSVIRADRGRHSAKPIEARQVIEGMYPHFDEASRIEFFARDPAPGWTVYGYEADNG